MAFVQPSASPLRTSRERNFSVSDLSTIASLSLMKKVGRPLP
jgi:hypothetical protein